MGVLARIGAVVLLLENLTACVWTPTRTTVILLPDEDGRVGAVTLKTRDDDRLIDRAYGAVTTSADGALPPTRSLAEQQVLAENAELLSAQPLRPANFTLYFDFDSVTLKDESQALIPQIVEKIREHNATGILIAGHADAVGADVRNVKLSNDRALTIADLLRKRVPDLGDVNILYFGAKEPAIVAPAGMPEPRNRRVEVVVY